MPCVVLPSGNGGSSCPRLRLERRPVRHARHTLEWTARAGGLTVVSYSFPSHGQSRREAMASERPAWFELGRKPVPPEPSDPGRQPPSVTDFTKCDATREVQLSRDNGVSVLHVSARDGRCHVHFSSLVLTALEHAAGRFFLSWFAGVDKRLPSGSARDIPAQLIDTAPPLGAWTRMRRHPLATGFRSPSLPVRSSANPLPSP